MPEHLIRIAPIEPDLTGAMVDARLAAGFFPWGQQWMTCRAWPMEDGPHDTIWVRVRLAPRRPSDRTRKLSREGCTVAVCAGPVLDEEHQRLYDRFRADRHADWTPEVGDLLLHDDTVSPIFGRTRELTMRDANGELIAFRWFLEGEEAIAGIAAIYDTTRSGLGTVARALADQWAFEEGLRWSYPGYVWPGAEDPWYYKIRKGCTEWLDPATGRWRGWDGDEPRAEALGLAEMRRRLAVLGDVVYYPGWVVPCVDPASQGLPAPYFVAGPADGDELIVVTWNLTAGDYEQFRVVQQPVEQPSGPGGPPHACA